MRPPTSAVRFRTVRCPHHTPASYHAVPNDPTTGSRRRPGPGLAGCVRTMPPRRCHGWLAEPDRANGAGLAGWLGWRKLHCGSTSWIPFSTACWAACSSIPFVTGSLSRIEQQTCWEQKKKGKIKIKREKEKPEGDGDGEDCGHTGTHRTNHAGCVRLPSLSPLEVQKRRFVSVEALEGWAGLGWAHGKFLPGSCRHGSGFVGWAHGRSNGQWKGTRRLFQGGTGPSRRSRAPRPAFQIPSSPVRGARKRLGRRAWLCPSMRDASSADWGRSPLTAGALEQCPVFCMWYCSV